MGWNIVIDEAGNQSFNLYEATKQGYNVLVDNKKITIQVSFNATGVTHYSVGIKSFITPLGSDESFQYSVNN